VACPSQYTDADIQPIAYPGEHVRRRPGMYIGNTDATGLHFTLFALVSSALREIAAGVGTFVSVRLNADGSATVEDNAPPISPEGDPPLEFVCTQWLGHAPNPNGRDYNAYFVANAVAAQFRVTASAPYSTYTHVFRQGLTHAAVQMGGPPDARGFEVEFRPDPAIFPNASFDADTIRDRLRVLAYLHSGVRVSFAPFGGAREDFCFADGTREYVRSLVGAEKVVHAEPIVLRGEANGVRYEVSLQWCADGETRIASGANVWPTSHGGTHESGLRAGVSRVVLALVRERVSPELEPSGEDARSGLRAAVAVRVADPAFESQHRERFTSPEAEGIVASAVRAGLSAHFDAHPADADAIARHVALAAEARVAAQKARRAKRSGA
jgi:DNA gyrase subunit B